jgi:DNA-nicking Smr family endonuclease
MAENHDRRADAALWEEAVRSVAPLRRRAPAARHPTSAVAGSSTPARRRADGLRQPEAGSLDRPAGIDRATAERLKRGLRPIEARLDLHGMTQTEAHRTLTEFVQASTAAGRRCLLVITGRGLGREQPGILRDTVPRWLDAEGLRQQILAVATAQPHHGGAGAFYVLLRRRR